MPYPRALIKIGHAVVESEGDVVAHEIRTLFTSDNETPELIISIIKSAEVPERNRMGLYRSFAEDLESLVETAQSYGNNSFDGLADAAAMLKENVA